MNKKQVVLAISFAMTSVAAIDAMAYDGSQYAGEAKITIEQARALAVKAYPGSIVEEELEHKRGGSGLRYSFDVRANHLTHEVAVDAKTGKILENSRESENEDD